MRLPPSKPGVAPEGRCRGRRGRWESRWVSGHRTIIQHRSSHTSHPSTRRTSSVQPTTVSTLPSSWGSSNQTPWGESWPCRARATTRGCGGRARRRTRSRPGSGAGRGPSMPTAPGPQAPPAPPRTARSRRRWRRDRAQDGVVGVVTDPVVLEEPTERPLTSAIHIRVGVMPSMLGPYCCSTRSGVGSPSDAHHRWRCWLWRHRVTSEGRRDPSPGRRPGCRGRPGTALTSPERSTGTGSTCRLATVRRAAAAHDSPSWTTPARSRPRSWTTSRSWVTGDPGAPVAGRRTREVDPGSVRRHA